MYTSEVFLSSIVGGFESFSFNGTLVINTELKKILNKCRWPQNHRTVEGGKGKLNQDCYRPETRKTAFRMEWLPAFSYV